MSIGILCKVRIEPRVRGVGETEGAEDRGGRT